MADTKLNIVIAAKDGASSALSGVAARLGSVVAAARRAGDGLGSGLLRGVTSMPAQLAALSGGALTLGAAFATAKASVEKASEFEDIRTSFITLLGSTDAAQKRMDELSKFAASTPFDIPGVARASKTLETLTRGALSTGPGLTLVGDVAASTGVQFDEMAVTIGRAYDGIASGRAVGESLMRLQELGALSGDARGKIESMQAAGQKGAAVWSVMSGELARFGGEMDRRSGTFSGKMSNMKDNWDSLLRAFGEPVMDSLKPFLDDLGAWFEKLKPAAVEFGNTVSGAIDLVRAAFADSSLWSKALATLSAVGSTAALVIGNHIGNSLKAAAAMFAGALIAAAKSAGNVLSGGDANYADEFAAATDSMGKALEIDTSGAATDFALILKSELHDIWGDLPERVAKPSETVNKATPSSSDTAKQFSPKALGSSGDDLAKVGIFAGGAAGAMNYARRTADASERMAKSLGVLERNISAGPRTYSPSWG